jgi:hypothetical protein
MDPYLEHPAEWPEFHNRFVNALAEFIADGLPPAYRARMEIRSRVIDLSAEERSLIVPDVAVDRDPDAPPFGGGGGLATLADPVAVPLTVLDEATEGYIEIVHRPDRELVTVVEVLSPANKAGPDFEPFRRKRNAILKQAVHLVELDLLVGGKRVPTDAPLPPGDYLAAVSRWERRPVADIYAWSVRQPLSPIPVPLRAPDPDVRLDLAAAFAETYRRGRYDRLLERDVLAAPLAAADRDWARQLVTEKKPAGDPPRAAAEATGLTSPR